MHPSLARVPGEGENVDDEISTSMTTAAGSTEFSVRIQAGTLRQVAVRGGAYIVSSRLIVQVFSWSITIVAARFLRPYDYGIVTATTIFTTLADLLAEGGVCRALVHQPQVGRDELASAFTLNLFLSVGMYLLLFASAGAAASALQTPELLTVLRVAGLTLLLVPFQNVPTAILERRLQLGLLTTVGVSCSIFQGCLVLTLVLSGFGYWALILGFMFPKLLQVLILAWQTSWVPRLRWPGTLSSPLVSFGIPYTGRAALLDIVSECGPCHRGTAPRTHRTRLLFPRVHADLDAGGEARRGEQPGLFPDLLSYGP